MAGAPPPKWWRPTTLDELAKGIPQAGLVDLRLLSSDLEDAHLAHLPSNAARVLLTGCWRLRTLAPLLELPALTHVTCDVCQSVLPSAVGALRAKGVVVDTWGCWQLPEMKTIGRAWMLRTLEESSRRGHRPS